MDQIKHTSHRHGHAPRNGKVSPTYRSWANMIKRVTNPKSHVAKWYLERGIGVVDEWRQFSGFLADMGDRPPGMSLDRIDCDRGYCRDNCRWATITQQQNNRRSCVYVKIGDVTKTLTEWINELGVSRSMVEKRIYYKGYSPYEALTIPKEQHVQYP